MKKLEEYKKLERLYVPDWLKDRLQEANFELVESMQTQLLARPEMSEIFNIDRAGIEHLHHNQHALRNLLRTPFSMVAPTIQTVEDWRCLVENTTTTHAIDELHKKLPTLDRFASYIIGMHNKSYIGLVINLIHLNVLAAPLLGISVDLAKYLASVSAYDLNRAIARVDGLPLFKWRFSSPTFWYEFTTNRLSDEAVAHQIMLTSPIKTADLTYNESWSNFRLARARMEMYAEAMMAYGFRASRAATLFRLPPSHTRERYEVIHHRSSVSGNQVNSLPWFIESPAKRLHTSFYTWLYRSALASGANVPEALIATNDVYNRMFDTTPHITADRGCLLTNAMAVDTRLAIAPCRTCGTHYVVSNNDTKIEMHNNFTCPACKLQLTPRQRRMPKEKQSNAS